MTGQLTDWIDSSAEIIGLIDELDLEVVRAEEYWVS